MRVARQIVDTKTLAWQQISPTLSCKVLNGDRETGPHTMILRSLPREPNPPGGQYHDHDEEFYCLAGDFTFDGTCWFGPGGYGFYPAHFVHGASVYVRGGYELYVRNGGAGGAYPVAEPQSLSPYPLPTADASACAVAIPQAGSAGPGPGMAQPDWRFSMLRQHGESGSILLQPARDAASNPLLIGSDGLVELFVVSGAFHLATGETLAERNYAGLAGRRDPVELRASGAGQLLVSYEGTLQLQQVNQSRIHGWRS